MNRVLLVYAHCDDELLWGHPWLLDRSIERRVLICCSDRDNPARQSYRRGEEALAAVCADVGITEYRVMSGWFSEFYKSRTRGAGEGRLLKEWWEEAQANVHEMMQGCDRIAVHNPWGCYGHADHLLVRRMVMEMDRRPLAAWTDAFVQTSTWPVGNGVWLGTTFEDDHRTDPAEFARLKEHYVSRGCWTWSSEEPLDVTVYEENL